ncbi:MAG: helix-turn-helix domain-containing protein [Actinobacteria bacterium]|nr:helix-turn-helix domain-containing protein [Actinomycetota bacterium]
MQKLLLTPEEAARTIGVGRSKLYELLASGALASVKIGALRRVPVAALEEYVGTLLNSHEGAA